MEKIIVYICFISAINYIIVESEIFTFIRDWIKDKKIPLLHRSIDCTACTGIQLGIILGLFTNLVFGIAMGFASYIVLDTQYNLSILVASKTTQDHTL